MRRKNTLFKNNIIKAMAELSDKELDTIRKIIESVIVDDEIQEYADEHAEYWREQSKKALFDRESFFIFNHTGTIVARYAPNITNFPQDLFYIAHLVYLDTEGGISRFDMMHGNVSIEGYNEKIDNQCELYIRFRDDCITIARVAFVHRREGYMTKLYNHLYYVARRYKIKYIYVECVLSDEMRRWCKKNGFVKDNVWKLEDCWIKEVED